jgi:hypothetical protein
VTILLAVAQFLGGAILVIAATESLVKGLVGVSRALRIAPFVASALLSGLEAENIAGGWRPGAPRWPLGSAYGGAIFMLTVALGLGVRRAGRAAAGWNDHAAVGRGAAGGLRHRHHLLGDGGERP